jgi:hypothetical protein
MRKSRAGKKSERRDENQGNGGKEENSMDHGCIDVAVVAINSAMADGG